MLLENGAGLLIQVVRRDSATVRRIPQLMVCFVVADTPMAQVPAVLMMGCLGPSVTSPERMNWKRAASQLAVFGLPRFAAHVSFTFKG